MGISNQIALRECRYLSDTHFQVLYDAFLKAFGDYVFPFALTETQFRNHIALNAVDINRSVGCFADGVMAGFSLNGFGDWLGRTTVYDAGTGVIPEYRRQHVSNSMFDMMLPSFKADGIKQFLLEVITINTGAIRLYEKLGFKTVREFALLQCDSWERPGDAGNGDVEVRELDEPDWEALCGFWTCRPSWQASPAAVDRTRHLKRIFAAFLRGECAGYIVFSRGFGRVSQFAVSPAFRGRGVGTALMDALKRETFDGYSLQAINVDKSAEELISFFKKNGFYERLAQYEMVLDLEAI